MTTISRGRTLMTTNTKKWSREIIEKNDRIEQSQLYTNFQTFDDGRGRILVCSMNDGHPNYEEYAELFSSAPETKEELLSKRREVIDLTAELDRAKREVNKLEADNEAWREKVDYLEEQIAINQINQRYLRPLFLFVAGFVTAAIVSAFMRWYHV